MTDELTQPTTLTVQDRTGRLRDADVASLKEQACRALTELTKDAAGGGSVRVVVVSDIEMAAAHERFSGVAGTTDVLTFDLREDGAGPLDTDILICLDEAERCGAERGHPTSRELVLYIVHGVLHCLGHDDHDPAAYARMHAREDEVLEAIGIGRVFARDQKSLGGEH
ncbi:MAG: rRNA maturation RNase YbeY [Planctomycetes bacterium]|nr:rRNA maturation RNase YbeY [Planctomycetota bacterium]